VGGKAHCDTFENYGMDKTRWKGGKSSIRRVFEAQKELHLAHTQISGINEMRNDIAVS
jgi:hypothetical protein